MDIPYIGVGMGFRRQLKKQIYASKESIDCLEIITDQYMQLSSNVEELEELCDNFAVIPHGVGLSIGSYMPINPHYLRRIKLISDMTNSPYYSEHLCMTKAPGIDIGHLSPLWFTHEVLENVVGQVSRVQDMLGKPLVLENVSYLIEIPEATLTQTEFFQKLVERTQCGVLLDVTNVLINSINHQFDARSFLDHMPLNHVIQVHIAGGYLSEGIFVDSHSELVQQETWDLLQYLSLNSSIKSIILEHDSNFPDSFQDLLNQVIKSRNYIKK